MIKSFKGLKILSISLLLVGIVLFVFSGRFAIMLTGLAGVVISFMGSSDFKKKNEMEDAKQRRARLFGLDQNSSANAKNDL